MQKHKLATFGLALHVIILLSIKYLDIYVGIEHKALDDIFSIVTQKGIYGAGIFPVALFYLYKKSNIAWWFGTIYSIAYSFAAILVLGLAVVFYLEGTNSKNLIILLSTQVTIVVFCILQLASKQARILCSKSYRECVQPTQQNL